MRWARRNRNGKNKESAGKWNCCRSRSPPRVVTPSEPVNSPAHSTRFGSAPAGYPFDRTTIEPEFFNASLAA